MFNRLCLLLGCGLALPVLAQVGYLETPVQPASGQSALNFANGEDAGPIAQALRWTSTATALRYGRKLAPSSNAAARMLKGVRK